MKWIYSLLAALAMWLPHALAYELTESPEAAWADTGVTFVKAVSIDVIDKKELIVFRITLRVHPDFPAEYVYAEKRVTITGLPAAAPEPAIHWYPGAPEGPAAFADEVRLVKQSWYATYCVSVKADYHYGGKVTVIDTAPVCWTGTAPPPAPAFYFNESTFRAYEPSWGFNNCFHTFSWEMGGADMICSPEPFIGF